MGKWSSKWLTKFTVLSSESACSDVKRDLTIGTYFRRCCCHPACDDYIFLARSLGSVTAHGFVAPIKLWDETTDPGSGAAVSFIQMSVASWDEPNGHRIRLTDDLKPKG